MCCKGRFVSVRADKYKDILLNTEVAYAGVAGRGCTA